MSGIDALPAMTVSRMAPALAALAHLPALALAAVLLASGLMTSGTAIAILVGMLAASTAWLWRLPAWWVAINLGFVPLAWLSLQAAIAPGWFLVGFVLLALTSPGAVRTRVPLFLSSPRAAEELARRLPERGRFIDLGCGLGGPLARLARTRPDAILAGVEAAPRAYPARQPVGDGPARGGPGVCLPVARADGPTVEKGSRGDAARQPVRQQQLRRSRRTAA